MILDSIFNMFFFALHGLLDLIPSVDPFGANVSNNLIGIINDVSCFVPVGTFFISIGVWLALANLEFIISIVHWLVRKIPGVS